MKINNQSDFKIKEVTKNEDFNVRFRFEFFVYEFKKYVVSWDGKEYVNCKRLDDGSLEIIFNNPKFGLGQLKVRREYYISDKDFIDGIWNAVTVEKTGIYITDGETDDIDVENVIVPPYIKGEPGKDMKWSTMTQDEKDELINDLGEGINNSFVEAETTRNNNEELRKTAESARVTAEQGRVEAELKRGTDFDTLKSEMQTAIDEGKAATKETIAATEGLDAIVEDLKIKEISNEIIQEDVSEDVVIIATDSGKTVTEMRAETISDDDEECQSWNSDDYDGKGNGEQYAKITPDGFIAKKLRYKDKNGESHDVEAEIIRIDSKVISVGSSNSNGSFADRELIKQKAAYWIDNPVQNNSYEDWSYLEKKIAEVPKGRSFIFVTDTHWDSNSKKSNLIINYVKNRLGIKKGIFGGDSVGSWDSKYKAVRELSEYADEFTSVFGDDAIYCQGNHDGNFVGFNKVDSSANYADYLIDDDEIYKRTIGKCDKYAHFDEEAIASIDELPYTGEVKEQLRYFMKYSYYVDDAEAKIRYIVIDTGIGSSIQYRLLRSGYGSSMPLFYKTFCRFLRTVPDGYDVVVAGHMIAYYDTCFELIMSAFKAGAAKVIFKKEWEWKSVLGKPIFICEDDLNVNTEVSITDAFVKETTKVYATYKKIGGTWIKSSERFKATVYSSIEELRTKDVNPKVGDYAYIGIEAPYTKCVCNTDGIWEVTSETISNFQIVYGNLSVLLNHFVGGDSNSVQIETGFDKPFNNKIFSVSGHWHFDAATYSMSDNDVTDTVNATSYTDKNNYSENPALTNDAVLNLIFDTDSYNLGGTIEGVDSVSYNHNAGTTTEAYFNVVTIEDNDTITITGFGSGNNRKFNI